MLFSDMPKRAVIAAIVLMTLCAMIYNSFFSGWMAFYALSMSESMLAVAITMWSKFQKEAKDRRFFYIMAGFLLTSAAIVPLFRYDVLTFTEYLTVAQGVAVAHVLTMLTYSDGIRHLARNLRSHGTNRRSGFFNS